MFAIQVNLSHDIAAHQVRPWAKFRHDGDARFVGYTAAGHPLAGQFNGAARPKAIRPAPHKHLAITLLLPQALRDLEDLAQGVHAVIATVEIPAGVMRETTAINS